MRNRKLLTCCTVALLCNTAVLSSMPAAIAASELTLENYDLVEDGVLDSFDLVALKQQVITGERSISDAVFLQRWLLGIPEKDTVEINLSDLEVTEENTEFLLGLFSQKFLGGTPREDGIFCYNFEDDTYVYSIISGVEADTSSSTLLIDFYPNPGESRVHVCLYSCTSGYIIETRM